MRRSCQRTAWLLASLRSVSRKPPSGPFTVRSPLRHHSTARHGEHQPPDGVNPGRPPLEQPSAHREVEVVYPESRRGRSGVLPLAPCCPLDRARDGHGHGRHLPVAAGLDSGYPAVKDAYMTSESGSVVGIARQEPDLSFRPAGGRRQQRTARAANPPLAATRSQAPSTWGAGGLEGRAEGLHRSLSWHSLLASPAGTIPMAR